MILSQLTCNCVVVLYFALIPEMMIEMRIWVVLLGLLRFLWVGVGSCDLGELYLLCLLEGFLPGPRSSLQCCGDILSVVDSLA